VCNSDGPSDTVRAFVRWTLKNGKLIWLVASIAGLFATGRTVQLYMHLRSEIEELLPRDAPSVLALDEMRARSPGLQFLGVVVEAKEASQLPAAERFLDDLAARVRTYPPALVRDVRSGYASERAFVEKHAPLYVSVDDLREVKRRIEARRDFDVAKTAGTLLDDSEPPPSTDLSDIQRKYDDMGPEVPSRLTNPAMRTTMLFVEAGDFNTGPEQGRSLLDRVKSDVAKLDPTKYAEGLRVGYASDVASNVEELDALESDLSVSSILVVLAVIAVIVVYYRWWTSVPVLLLPVLLATVYAFSIASLPPFRVTELNSNSAFLGPIIIGNGINVGLVLLARYREARAAGNAVEEALVIGVWGARPGTLAAAIAASAACASAVLGCSCHGVRRSSSCPRFSPGWIGRAPRPSRASGAARSCVTSFGPSRRVRPGSWRSPRWPPCSRYTKSHASTHLVWSMTSRSSVVPTPGPKGKAIGVARWMRSSGIT
jgi:predicted RND superfamily exporter protein